MTTYIAYIDDSGNENRAVYLALLIPAERWSETLREWLTFRANVYKVFEVPADVELHAAEVVQAGKNILAPGVKYGVNTDAGRRKKLLNHAVLKIGQLEHVRIVSYQDTLITPAQCYERLLKRLETLLAAEDSCAIVIVDGEDSDTEHKKAHRRLKLDDRRVLEDPWKQDSKHSQLVQMADLAAYTLFQGHELFQPRAFMWPWMQKFLHQREWDAHCNCPT
ncbi:DUF3800 domain-containing protein [Arthrobacter sp. R4-81]